MADEKAGARVDLALLDPDGVFPARLMADRTVLAAWLRDMQTGEEQLKQIATLSHRLAGAAGTFGYPEVSDAALTLEELILDLPPGQSASARLDPVRQAADTLVRMVGVALARQTQRQ